MADFRRYAQAVRSGQILGDVAAMLDQCDAVLLNGENFIRPGTPKGRMLLFLAFLVKEVFRKPCLLTNHSLELGEPALVEIVREVYPALDEIHFREQTSLDIAASVVQPGPWRLIPDVAFAVPAAPLSAWQELGCRDGQFAAWPDRADGFDPRQPYVTVCASSIFAMPQHQHLDPVPAFIRLCRRLRETIGPVLLTAPCLPDTLIMRKVQAATGFPLLGNGIPVRQAIDILGNASVHVGGRWHLAIFAATGGTPTVGLGANSHKMQSLMRLLEMNEEVFDALQLDDSSEAITAQAVSHVAAGPVLRDRLLRRSQFLATRVDENLEWFRAR
jgi:polysaccharide pyruvyl transferase WcaK-like protein